ARKSVLRDTFQNRLFIWNGLTRSSSPPEFHATSWVEAGGCRIAPPVFCKLFKGAACCSSGASTSVADGLHGRSREPFRLLQFSEWRSLHEALSDCGCRSR